MNAPSEMKNPPLVQRGGLVNVHRLAADDIYKNTTTYESTEAFAVEFVARRCRITLPMARTVVALAGIAGRIA
jgi:hypothetical protein